MNQTLTPAAVAFPGSRQAGCDEAHNELGYLPADLSTAMTSQAVAPARELPRLRGGLPWLGHALALKRDPVGFLRLGLETAGDAFTFTLLGQRVAFMSGPRAHRAVFGADEDVLSCHEAYQFMVPIVGEGVAYGAERSVMEQQLKMVRAPLTGKQLRASAPEMAAEVQAHLDALGERGELDLTDMMAELTASIASRCLVGPEFRARLTKEARGLYHDLQGGVQLAGLINPRLPLPQFRRRDRARARIVASILDVIGERRRAGVQDGPEDMLTTLLSARYADGSAPTDDVIAGVLLTLIFVGHHTSAAHAAWTGALMLAHPEWYQRARAEQDGFAEQSPELTPGNLHHMTVLDQCLKEAERMFPPVPLLMRVVKRDFVHDGYTVPKGALLFLSPGASHRRPDVFRDPDEYCPARFGPGRAEDRRTQHGLIGFGGGQHACIGLGFAQQQVKMIWSLLLREFDLEAMQPLGPPDHSTFVVMPGKPCMVRYRRREAVRETAALWRRAARRRQLVTRRAQRGVLRHRNAALPAASGLVPGLGPRPLPGRARDTRGSPGLREALSRGLGCTEDAASYPAGPDTLPEPFALLGPELAPFVLWYAFLSGWWTGRRGRSGAHAGVRRSR